MKVKRVKLKDHIRYIIFDKNNKVISDANGYGYTTPNAAYRALAYIKKQGNSWKQERKK